MRKTTSGFTIVELLIVIVVIAILATVTVVAFNGVRERARDSRIRSDIANVNKLILQYYAENGSYPATGSTITSNAEPSRSDANCSVNWNNMTTWVPSLTQNLPQNDGTINRGAKTANSSVQSPGCYMYISDGTNYVLSAWNMLSAAQTSTMYRRLGFAEITGGNRMYICNHTNIGGNNGGSYDIGEDYYKFSYTISSITSCNETPPAGA